MDRRALWALRVLGPEGKLYYNKIKITYITIIVHYISVIIASLTYTRICPTEYKNIQTSLK